MAAVNNKKAKNLEGTGYTKKFLVLALIFLAVCICAISFLKQNKNINKQALAVAGSMKEIVVFDDIKMLIPNSARLDEINDSVTAYLKESVKYGDTIIDVSYGYGAYSLLMAKLAGLAGRVYTYNPSSSSSLMASAKLNNFIDRIYVKELGICDHTFDGVLIYKSGLSPINGHIEKVNFVIPSEYSAMKIKVSSLDEQLPRLQNIDVLKINTNGNETDVINGAINLIKKSNKIKIIVTFNNVSFKGYSLIERLILLGFNLFIITENGKAKPISVFELKSIENGTFLLKKGLK